MPQRESDSSRKCRHYSDTLLVDVLTSRAGLDFVNEFNRARRNSLPYVGGRESCVSCANPNVGMRLTFQLSLRQGIAGARQSWLRVSGQRPAEFKWVSKWTRAAGPFEAVS
jgi:hypothetical protein